MLFVRSFLLAGFGMGGLVGVKVGGLYHSCWKCRGNECYGWKCFDISLIFGVLPVPRDKERMNGGGEEEEAIKKSNTKVYLYPE